MIDSCFRAFDTRAQYDSYAVLDESGVEYVVIEDTGKLWPAGGIKLGFTVTSARNRLPIVEVAADILLTAGAFATAVVEAFALDMAAGGLATLQARIDGNRAILREELARSSIAPPRGRRFPGERRRASSSRGACPARGCGASSSARGVHSVPCRPFYWARPSVGERYLRVALAREPEVVRRAAQAIVETLELEAAA